MSRSSKISFLFIVSLFFVFVPTVHAQGQLVKSPHSDTIYYVDEHEIRHAFPNRTTYESWYGDNFSQVSIVSDEVLSQYRLGPNIVMRPGKYLLKVPSSPEVYAVEPGGVLRHVSHADTAKAVYGSNWEYKMRDLPEVFFTNYTIGDRIDFSHQIPDGVVYQVEGSDAVYWKNKQVLQPFGSESDMRLNGYTKSDIILSELNNFYKRSFPIVGESPHVFNPVLASNDSTSSCRVDQFNVAIVFVTQVDDLTERELDVMQFIIDELPGSFNTATQGLSSITVDPNVGFIKDTSGILTYTNDFDKTALNLEEVSHTFYDVRPDDYDFLIIFNDFLGSAYDNEVASFSLVHNDFDGGNRIRLDRSKFYGSHGRLKGAVHMNNINQYSLDSSDTKTQIINLIHHEMLHQWGVGVTYMVSENQRSYDLLSDDQNHWTKYATFVSPLGGWGFVHQGDNIYKSTRSFSTFINFPEIDLYLMGLLPAPAVDPIHYVIPDDPSDEDDTITGTLQQVTIDQITNAHGPVRCVIDD